MSLSRNFLKSSIESWAIRKSPPGKLICAGTWFIPRRRTFPPNSSARISISSRATCKASSRCPPRWKTCTRLIDRDLGEALGQVFVARTFSPQTKQDALRVTQEIEHEMGHDIKDLAWMSEATKQQALEKLNAVVNKSDTLIAGAITVPSKSRPTIF